MTYLHEGTEYLDSQEMKIYQAVQRLSREGRTVNNSQVANACGIGRTTVTGVLHHLAARGYLRDVSRGAAYHWRTTPKVPAARTRRSA